MNEVSNKLASITEKLERVHRRFDKLKQENKTLEKKNTELMVMLDREKENVEALQNDYNRLKLAKTVVSTTADKAEMKFRVNELVREINKCIALLNR